MHMWPVCTVQHACSERKKESERDRELDVDALTKIGKNLEDGGKVFLSSTHSRKSGAEVYIHLKEKEQKDYASDKRKKISRVVFLFSAKWMS